MAYAAPRRVNDVAEMFAHEVETAPIKHLDYVAHRFWQAHSNGTLTDNEAQGLAEALADRQRERPAPGPKPTPAALSVPRRAYPKRPYQRSPDRAASIERRRRLAASGPVPPTLACRFTTSELAVLRIVGDEVQQHGVCSIHLDAIASRAGVCRRLAQSAIRLAYGLGLLVIEERRRRGLPSLTNIVRILSPEWKAWLKRGEGAKRFRPRSQEVKQEQIRSAFGAGSHFQARQNGKGGSCGNARRGYRTGEGGNFLPRTGAG